MFARNVFIRSFLLISCHVLLKKIVRTVEISAKQNCQTKTNTPFSEVFSNYTFSINYTLKKLHLNDDLRLDLLSFL